MSFQVTPDKLQFYDIDMKRVVEPGEFQVMVGTSSAENLNTKFERHRIGTLIMKPS